MGLWRRIAGYFAVCAIGAVAPLLAQTSIASAMLARERSSLVNAPITDPNSGVVQPPISLEGALQKAFASAGVVFTGEVVSIDRTPGAVIVRWLVEDAVAGVTAGALYEQKEWPGLWVEGNARYQVGERALVLLHTPSVAGYASPVSDGVIPLRGDRITGTLDLRWMEQQVVVTDAARLHPMLALRAAGGDFALSDALLKGSTPAAVVPQSPLGLPALNSSGTVLIPTSTDVQADDANAHVDGAMILSMLHAWQRASAAAR